MDFQSSIGAYWRFLDTALPEVLAEEPSGPRVGVVVSPWVQTPVPWYSLTLALLLRLEGLGPEIVWDDLPFERDAAVVDMQNQAIGLVLDRLAGQGFPVRRLSQAPRLPLDAEARALVESSALMNAQWLRTSALSCPELDAVRDHCRERLLPAMQSVLGLFATSEHSFLLVPGGVYRTSGLFLFAGRRHSRPVATYDSGAISMAVGLNEVAAQFMDLPETFRRVRESGPEVKRAVLAKAKSEFHKRLTGQDKYSYQRTGVGQAGPDCDVLIPLNIETDATALGKSRFFETSWHWLVSTLDFLLARTPARVVVRQHPYEARKPGDRLALKRSLEARFPSDRLLFLSCYDEVNTYDLLRACRLVLPYVSTIGIEAAMLGKRVIVESSVYYATLPFVRQPASREEYFAAVAAALEDNVAAPAPDAVMDAWLAFYLSTICGRIWTDFTPQPANFGRWSGMALRDIHRDGGVQDLLEAIRGRRSVTAIQHDNFLLRNNLCSSGRQGPTVVARAS